MAAPLRSMITGVTKCYPNKVYTNKDLEKVLDTSDEWIRTRTGIQQRHFADNGKPTSYFATKAVESLLKKTNTKPEEVDLILVGTITPDMVFPSTACLIQKNIGAVNAWGFDMSAACSGFVYALSVGDQFIRTGKHKKVVVVGYDVMSSILNKEDRTTYVLFGDGGGAAMLEPTQEGTHLGILDSVCRVDGAGGECLYMPAGGSLNPATHETVDKQMHYVHQEGKQVYKSAVSEMANVSLEILERNGLTGKDVDLFVAHQANLRIIESTQKKLGLPDEKVIVTIDKYANTTAGTIPTCLTEAVSDGRLTKGNLVLVTSFGAGFTWGSTLIRWAY